MQSVRVMEIPCVGWNVEREEKKNAMTKISQRRVTRPGMALRKAALLAVPWPCTSVSSILLTLSSPLPSFMNNTCTGQVLQSHPRSTHTVHTYVGPLAPHNPVRQDLLLFSPSREKTEAQRGRVFIFPGQYS